MKINILTQPLYSNYGGILQNYALQQALRSLGYEPLTVNIPKHRPAGAPLWKDAIKSCLNLVRRMRGDYDCPFLSPNRFAVKEFELCTPQRDFIRKYIAKVDAEPPFTAEVCRQYPADAWIVGSDQVWRPWCSPYLDNCFFDFVESPGIKKIAYAASFGTDRWEIDAATTDRLKPLVRQFKAISVREASGVRLCQEYLDVNALHVLDPTLLLGADDYISLTSYSDSPDGNYLATYILDGNREKNAEIRRISRKYGLRIEQAGAMHRDSYDSIEHWLATLANAERVVTDSFHGTVFSILFRRPVKILQNGLRGNSRLESLINFLALKPDSEGFYVADAETKKLIEKYRDEGLDFLRTNLV